MRKKDDRKIVAISNATQKIVCEHGLDRASIANIAKEAKVSPATIYLYFEDKSDLLSKVFYKERQAMQDEGIAALSAAAGLPFSDKFASVHKATFRYMWANPISLRFMEILKTTPYNNPQEMGKQYGYDKVFAFWRVGIEQGILEDTSLESITLMTQAPLIEAVLQFHALYCSCQGHAEPHDEAAHEMAAEYVERLETIQAELLRLTWKALVRSN